MIYLTNAYIFVLTIKFMIMKKTFLTLGLATALVFGFTSCTEKKQDKAEDKMEEAGESIEEAAEDAGDAIEDGAEKVGDKVEEGAEEVEEEFEN